MIIIEWHVNRKRKCEQRLRAAGAVHEKIAGGNRLRFIEPRGHSLTGKLHYVDVKNLHIQFRPFGKKINKNSLAIKKKNLYSTGRA